MYTVSTAEFELELSNSKLLVLPFGIISPNSLRGKALLWLSTSCPDSSLLLYDLQPFIFSF